MPLAVHMALRAIIRLAKEGNGGFTGSVAGQHADAALNYVEQSDFVTQCRYVVANLGTMRGDKAKEARKVLKDFIKNA
jgi:hypothetical protein